MKQIYDFEQAVPPVLTEAMLRARIRQKKQALWLSISGILTQLCVLMLAALLFAFDSAVAWICVGYAAVSLIGWVVFALFFNRNRRFLMQ